MLRINKLAAQKEDIAADITSIDGSMTREPHVIPRHQDETGQGLNH